MPLPFRVLDPGLNFNCMSGISPSSHLMSIIVQFCDWYYLSMSNVLPFPFHSLFRRPLAHLPMDTAPDVSPAVSSSSAARSSANRDAPLSYDSSQDTLQDLITRGLRLREQLARANTDLLRGDATRHGGGGLWDARLGAREEDEDSLDGSSLDASGSSSSLPVDDDRLLDSLFYRDGAESADDDSDEDASTFEFEHKRAATGSTARVQQASDEQSATSHPRRRTQGAVAGTAVPSVSAPTSAPVPAVDDHPPASPARPRLPPLDVRRLTQLGRVVRVVVHVHALEAQADTLDRALDAGDSAALELALPGRGLNPNTWQPQATHVLRFAARKRRQAGLVFDRRVEMPARFDEEAVAAWQRAVVVFRLQAHGGEGVQSDSVSATQDQAGVGSGSDTAERHAQRLVGLASFRLADVLVAEGLRLDAALPLVGLPRADRRRGASGAAQTGNVDVDSDNDGASAEESSADLGTLHVTFQLQAADQAEPESVRELGAAATATTTAAPTFGGPKQVTPAAAAVPPTDPNARPVHFFLLVQDAKGVPPRGSSTTTPGASRNLYVVSRLPAAPEPGRSAVVWNTGRPEFHHQHAVPAFLTAPLLQQLHTGMCVVEVWDRCGGRDATDALVGLVKVPTRDLYLSLHDANVAIAVMRSDLPVVCCNGYRPIVDPVGGHVQGQLRVLLAAGSQRQVALLARHGAGPQPAPGEAAAPGTSGYDAAEGNGGAFADTATLPPGVRFATRGPQTETVAPGGGGSSSETLLTTDAYSGSEQATAHRSGDDAVRSAGGMPPLVAHEIEVAIPHVRNLDVFANTLYGEADCFVQYSFPEAGAAQAEAMYVRAARGEEGVPLAVRREARSQPVLCLPNAVLDHRQRHTLLTAAQQHLADALLPALAEGLQVALYKRSYYPNVRDQHLATAVLPASQLRAFSAAAAAAGESGTAVRQCWTLRLFPAEAPSHLDGAREVGTLALELCCRTNPHTPDAALTRLVRDAAHSHARVTGHADGGAVQVRVHVKRATGLRAALRGAARALGQRDLSLATDAGPPVYLRVALAHAAPLTTHDRNGSDDAGDDSKTSTARTPAGIWAHNRASPWARTSAQARSFAPDVDETLSLEGEAAVLLVEVWLQSSDASQRAEEPGRQPDALLATGTVELRGLAGRSQDEVALWCTLHGAGSAVASGGARGPWRVAGAVQLGLTLTPRGPVSEPTVLLQADALLRCRCQIQVIVEDVHLPAPVTGRSAATDRGYLWQQRVFYVRYVLPDGRVQRSAATALGAPVPGLPSDVVNLQHRGAAAFSMTPAAALALAGQLELQLWCRPRPDNVSGVETAAVRVEDGAAENDDAEEWLGSAFIDTHTLLRGRVSASAVAALVRPYAADLGEGRMRAHVLMDVLDHPSSGSGGGRDLGASGPGPSALDHEAGLSSGDNAAAADRDGAGHEVYVTVERALHLQRSVGGVKQPLPANARAYVSYGSGRTLVCTQLVSGGRCPVWEHKRTLHVPISVADQRCSRLVFRVWSREGEEENETWGPGLEPRRDGEPARGSGHERLLGQATVDLVPLALGIPLLEGWYHIVGPTGESIGQLLVRVRLLHAMVVIGGGRGAAELGAASRSREEDRDTGSSAYETFAAQRDTSRRTEGQATRSWMGGDDSGVQQRTSHAHAVRGADTDAAQGDAASPPELSSSFLRQKLERNLHDLDTIRATLSQRAEFSRSVPGAEPRHATEPGPRSGMPPPAATRTSTEAFAATRATDRREDEDEHEVLARSRALLARLGLRKSDQEMADEAPQHLPRTPRAATAASPVTAAHIPAAGAASFNVHTAASRATEAGFQAAAVRHGDERGVGFDSNVLDTSTQLLDDVDQHGLDLSGVSSMSLSPPTPRRHPPAAAAAVQTTLDSDGWADAHTDGSDHSHHVGGSGDDRWHDVTTASTGRLPARDRHEAHQQARREETVKKTQRDASTSPAPTSRARNAAAAATHDERPVGGGRGRGRLTSWLVIPQSTFKWQNRFLTLSHLLFLISYP